MEILIGLGVIVVILALIHYMVTREVKGFLDKACQMGAQWVSENIAKFVLRELKKGLAFLAVTTGLVLVGIYFQADSVWVDFFALIMVFFVGWKTCKFFAQAWCLWRWWNSYKNTLQGKTQLYIVRKILKVNCFAVIVAGGYPLFALLCVYYILMMVRSGSNSQIIEQSNLLSAILSFANTLISDASSVYEMLIGLF